LDRQYPELHSFYKNKLITLKGAKYSNVDDLYDNFHLPLFMVVADQFNDLSEIISQHNDLSHVDTWKLPWNGDKYSRKKVYSALTKEPDAPPPFKWVW
jgi:hypothetical protein